MQRLYGDVSWQMICTKIYRVIWWSCGLQPSQVHYIAQQQTQCLPILTTLICQPTNKYFVITEQQCIFWRFFFRNDTAGDNFGILDPYSFRHKPSHTPTEVTTSQHSEFIWPALLVRINTSVSNKASSRMCHLEGDQLFPIVRFVYTTSASSCTNFRE